MEQDPDPFGFNSLFYIKRVEDSKKLNDIKKPCVIISASGMMEAGRVKHHLANSISNPANTVLAVGYCAPRTLGARLLRGDKEVSIHGVKYPVLAEIKRLDSFSGHGDYKEMESYLSCQDPSRLQKIFLVHGEYGPQQFYKSYLESCGYRNISIPEVGHTEEISSLSDLISGYFCRLHKLVLPCIVLTLNRENMRTVNRTIRAEKVNMGGIILDQALPVSEVEQIDPFLLIHHWDQHYEKGHRQNHLGVGPHPHRGFAPVTFIFKGGLHHRDSRGGSSVVYEGGTQWINSGMGIIHSERPSKDIAENGGDLELIQFWINLPAKHKMDQPVYLPLTEKQTPTWESADKSARVMVVAGKFRDIPGGIQPLTPLEILRIELKKGASISLPVPPSFNALVYLLDGKVRTGGHEIRGKEMAVFDPMDGDIELEALEDTRAILLSGEPLNEPVAASGPFVMNTDTEILEAMRDYRMGKMGVLIEEFD